MRVGGFQLAWSAGFKFADDEMTRLKESEIEQFQRDGFIGPIRAVSTETMERFAAGIPGILAAQEPTHHRHLDKRGVYELCASPAIVGRIASLIGPDILLWSSNFFVKEPGARGTPWHQDQNNGGPAVLEPPLNISVWLAIDDVLTANSCMKFLAGSHLTAVNHAPPADGDYFGRADTGTFDLAKAKDMELRRGELVIFTDRVLHGAEPNHSDRRRAGLAMRFTTPFVKILRKVKPLLVGGEDRFGFNPRQEPPS